MNNVVLNFLLTNDAFILSCLTMGMSIYAGFIPKFESHGWRITVTSVLTLIVDLYIWMLCHHKENAYSLGCGIIVSMASIVFILLCIFVFKPKDIVGRRHLANKIIKLTKNSDTNSPICIFGGDLDFFGNVSKPSNKKAKWWNSIIQCFSKDYKSNIEYNKQMQQIITLGFSEVRILCSEPIEQDTRLRYGYIADKLKNKVAFRFMRETAPAIDNDICKCQNCSYKSKCKNPGKKCSRLEDLGKQLSEKSYSPDTKLRGRIIGRPGVNAKDIILTTTIKRKKKYRIREYGLSNKHDRDKLDWKLYDIIWDVWWKNCSTNDEDDKKIIDACKTEYLEYKENEAN